MAEEKFPPVCDYEGSDYQDRFWDKGGRSYEDKCEALALKRLLPHKGKLLLELGAGAGRNTLRYAGFDRVVLLDYSRTQLQQAREKLGESNRYVFVVADIYRLPFIEKLFDTATMIRVLHHMADAPSSLRQVRDTLQPGATFILEFANKRNIKAILRYAARRQVWNPFEATPVEFAPLNFDFHPRNVNAWLSELGFYIERELTVSHFRMNFLKKFVPLGILVFFESLLQRTGAIFQFTPSIFLRARLEGETPSSQQRVSDISKYFKCPNCGFNPLDEHTQHLACPSCDSIWHIEDGIYIFKG
jgi:ubiquinone/menaquinone biosynthesis C-methylase UbiE